MQYAYICAHTHTYMHTVPKYGTYNITLYACMRVWSVGLCEWLGTGNKREAEKKMQTHQPLHTAQSALCTARSVLHGRVVVSPRLASPRIASHRIASPSQVDTYLYFLV